ncbi:retrovirus-related Pol polyprotein from transposon TNT 1-94 [Trichonephila clavipes]|nr:retrovirus-related Pol polyprotein from transposon TNT 1-94 [Trichonephila clavipes]
MMCRRQARLKKYDACRRQIYRPISKRNRRTTAQQVANQFLAASGKQISRKTVARRLREEDYTHADLLCVPMTDSTVLPVCNGVVSITIGLNRTGHAYYSQMSRFRLSSDSRRQLIWREWYCLSSRKYPGKDRYPTCSIMVWAGIMINGHTRLHVVANGTMTGQRYIDEVLLPHVRLFRGAVGDKFVFMDDNATCHGTLAVQDCLDSEGIQRLVWPVRSPDLNPIENVWDALGRQVAGRNYPPTNKNTLIRALTEEWDKLPQQLLDNVVQNEQALQFAAEDNAKVLWDKIRATYIGEGEDRKIDASNELKNIRMKNGETVADYIARARGISTKCHSLGLDVSPRELVYHTVRGLNGKFSKVRDILKTQRGKSMDEILQILREEEATLNLPIKTRMDGINESFYCKRKNEKQTRLCYICRKSNHLAKDCYYRNKNSPSTSQRNNSSRNGHVFTASHPEEKLCDNIWILDSGASCHMAKESAWFKNISPEVMDIYLADKNSKMMSQGTGNVSAKTVSTKRCNSINLTITDVSYVPQLRCNLLSVTCLMDKGRRGIMLGYAKERRGYRIYDIKNQKVIEERSVKFNEYLKGSNYLGEIENETWDIDSFFEVSPERNEINQNTENGVLYNFDINNGPGAIENDNSIPFQTTSSPRTGRIQIPVFELNDVQNQIPVRRSERLKSKLMSVHLVNNVPNSYFEAEIVLIGKIGN